jgi:hypothetical protein
MTTTPFDDPIAFHRRWGHPDVSHLHALATSDPLLFAADHVMSGDRRVGSVALCVALRQGPTGLICIPDAPPDPTDTDCLALLGTAIQGVSDPDADHGAHHAVRALGIVHHRLGRRGASDSDRRWALALKAGPWPSASSPSVSWRACMTAPWCGWMCPTSYRVTTSRPPN